MNETQQSTATEIAVDGHVEEQNAHHVHAHVSQHVNKYLMVGGLLLAFTALTVFLSYKDFGSRKLNVTIGMLVATVKASMVAAIFMHLNAERQLIYRILIFTAFFALAMFFLTYLHWYDPISR